MNNNYKLLNLWRGFINKAWKWRSETVVIADNCFSRFAGTGLGILLFLIFSVTYCRLVYFNFNSFEIIGLFISYSLIWILGWRLLTKGRTFLTYYSAQNSKLEIISAGFLISCYLFLLLLTCLDNWSEYAPTFPLIEAELGLGWHQDTAFHVSLIQSIKSFGYPSIMQDGHPLAAYHALTHYIDALLLGINDAEPYDSYGLIFFIKGVVVLCSLVVIIFLLTLQHGLTIYFFSLVVVIPCVIGTWAIVGSHSQWLSIVIMILSIPYVSRVLFEENNLKNFDLYALLILVVLISLSKISNGLIFCVFIFSNLLLKFPNKSKIYVAGIFLAIFFYIYGVSYFTRLNGSTYLQEIMLPSLNGFHDYFFGDKSQGPTIVFQITLCFYMFGMLFILRPSLKLLKGAISSLLTICSAYLIATISPGLDPSDIGYIHHATSTTLMLFLFAMIVLPYKYSNSYSEDRPNRLKVYSILNVFMLSIFILATKTFEMPRVNFFNITFKNFNEILLDGIERPFKKINQYFPGDQKINIFSTLDEKNKSLAFIAGNQYLTKFRSNLFEIMKRNGVDKSQSILFLSKEVFENDIKKSGGEQWADGMLLSAITGVQMAYGIYTPMKFYGYGRYGKSSLRISTAEFGAEMICVKDSKALGFAFLHGLNEEPVNIHCD